MEVLFVVLRVESGVGVEDAGDVIGLPKVALGDRARDRHVFAIPSVGIVRI